MVNEEASVNHIYTHINSPYRHETSTISPRDVQKLAFENSHKKFSGKSCGKIVNEKKKKKNESERVCALRLFVLLYNLLVSYSKPSVKIIPELCVHTIERLNE